jgi:hypothetical protein
MREFALFLMPIVIAQFLRHLDECFEDRPAFFR